MNLFTLTFELVLVPYFCSSLPENSPVINNNNNQNNPKNNGGAKNKAGAAISGIGENNSQYKKMAADHVNKWFDAMSKDEESGYVIRQKIWLKNKGCEPLLKDLNTAKSSDEHYCAAFKSKSEEYQNKYLNTTIYVESTNEGKVEDPFNEHFNDPSFETKYRNLTEILLKQCKEKISFSLLLPWNEKDIEKCTDLSFAARKYENDHPTANKFTNFPSIEEFIYYLVESFSNPLFEKKYRTGIEYQLEQCDKNVFLDNKELDQKLENECKKLRSAGRKYEKEHSEFNRFKYPSFQDSKTVSLKDMLEKCKKEPLYVGWPADVKEICNKLNQQQK